MTPNLPMPPNDRNAEQSVIGSVLRGGLTVFGDVPIRGDDFYVQAHQTIWAAFEALASDGEAIDPVTLANRLKTMKVVEDVTYAYIAQLWDAAPSTGNVSYYSEIVRKMSALRSLIRVAGTINDEAFVAGADPDQVMQHAEESLFRLTSTRYGSNIRSMAQLVPEALEVLERRSGRRRGEITEETIKTGWSNFDFVTGGLARKELCIFAARPSVGKTLAALNVMAHVAGNGGKVFFASLEQGNTENVHRILSRLSQVNGFKFRSGEVTPEDERRILESASHAERWNLFMDDHGGQTVTQIASSIRRLKRKGGLDLAVIDYLGLIPTPREEWTGRSRTDEIGVITRRLKFLAKEVDIPVLCLAQLNRNSENRADPKPKLADLRDSGNIEQDADMVVLLHKPDPPCPERETDLMEIIVAKQRNGPVGEVKMVHAKRFFEIKELTGGIP